MKITTIRGLKNLLIGAIALLQLVPLMAANETVSIARQTSLHTDRYLDSRVIQRLSAGQSADVLKVEGGWVQIKIGKEIGWVRAMFLGGQGAARAQVAQLEAGRSSKLHKVSTTGIRSIARASRHALIIGVGEYTGAGITDLLGVKHDVVSATTIAEAMGVPQENITYLRDKEATGEGIRRALSEIDQRTRSGDRVFVYYSGHGTRWIDASFDPNSCTEGLLASDGQALTNREISALLKPVSAKADKLMVFYDACHSGGIAQQPLKTRSIAINSSTLVPKFSSQVSPDLCAKPSNMRTRSLSGELGKIGAVPENTVFIAASRPDEVSFDDPQSGGLATVAWRDCLLGGTKDLDGSGSISVAEMTQCAQAALNIRLGDQPDILGQRMTVGGNSQFVPAFLNNVLESNDSQSTDIAEAEAEAKRQALLEQQQAETARLKAEQEALEKAELLKQEERARQLAEAEAKRQALLEQQQAETARLKAEQEALEKAELLKQEERARQLAEAEAKRQALLEQQQAETARLKAEQEALEKAELLKQEARARQLAEAEAKRQALLAQQQAETARLKAEQEALEKAELLKQEERARQLAEAEAKRQALLEQQQAETARLKAEQEALEKAELLKQEERARQLAEAEAKRQALLEQQQAEAAKELANVEVSEISPGQNFADALQMDPVVPDTVVTPIKPAGLLAQIHQQRDGSRTLSVKPSRKILRIDKDPLELTVKSKTDGYLYIALAGSDQKSLYLLFPNRIDSDNFVKANQEIKLPRRNWRIVAGGPKGIDTVLVMVTDSPRDLSQLTGESAGPFTMPLMTKAGKSRLQLLLNESGNSDQVVCQAGGKTRNLKVQLVCSDSYASDLIEFEER